MYMSRIFQNLSTMAIFVAAADILKWITGGDIFHFTPIFFNVKHILYKIVTCTVQIKIYNIRLLKILQGFLMQ